MDEETAYLRTRYQELKSLDENSAWPIYVSTYFLYPRKILSYEGKTMPDRGGVTIC